jgi:hypothetical protein
MDNITIHTGVWNDEYWDIFFKYNLQSILSKNILAFNKKKFNLNFAIDSSEDNIDKYKNHACILKLRRYANVQFNKINIDEFQDKYSFLLHLQLAALNKLKKDELIIFNYADFIWSNNSFSFIRKKIFKQGYEAVLTFALPLDKNKCVYDLNNISKKHNYNNNKIYTNNEIIKQSLKNLHREGILRFIENEYSFTVTPSYLLWRLKNKNNNGIIIRAYHKTPLCTKKTEKLCASLNNSNHISLDESISPILNKKINCYQVNNFKDLAVISLFNTKSDSSIGGMSRESWGIYNKYDSIKDFLLESASNEHRDFAMSEISLYTKKDKIWGSKIKKTKFFLKRLHNLYEYRQKKFKRFINHKTKYKALYTIINILLYNYSTIRDLIKWNFKTSIAIIARILKKKFS